MDTHSSHARRPAPAHKVDENEALILSEVKRFGSNGEIQPYRKGHKN
jgi:hypothetical protein